MKKPFVINEEKVIKDRYYHVEYFQLFSENKDLKNKYKIGIIEILKSTFSEYWGKQGDDVEGIYDFECGGRSVLNYLSSNIMVFCVLVKEINKVLLKVGQPLLDFGNTKESQKVTIERMMTILKSNSSKIFNEEHTIFNTIMSKLTETYEKGKKTELNVFPLLKKVYGEDNVIISSGSGKKDDMFGGVDVTINIDGVNKTGQIKPYQKIEKGDGFIKFVGAGLVKDYSTDFLIFNNTKELYVVKNNQTIIVNGDYKFPIESVVHILSK